MKSLTGFTLLEVLVSVMILAFLLTGIVYVFITGKTYTSYSRSKIYAGEVVKYFVEPLQSQVAWSAWGTNCLSGNWTNPAGCDTTAQTDPTTNITYSVTYYNTAWTLNGVNMRKVRVTINWSVPF